MIPIASITPATPATPASPVAPLAVLAQQQPGSGFSPSASFASADERYAACIRLELAGMVVAELESIGPTARGRLSDVIDEAVERALGARGAPGPGLASTGDRDARLSDQLFRARRAGARGIAVVLGPLQAAANAMTLVPDDCATLRFYVRATSERPLVILLDTSDERTGGHGEPVPLCDLLNLPSGPAASEPVHSSVPTQSPAALDPAVHIAALAEPEQLESPPSPPVAPAPRAAESEHAWRGWTLQLSAARGPQPLSSLEKLFSESYMPLTNAIASGLDDGRARHAHDEFTATFAKGYTDAFSMFAATTKRPRLVLDAHDLAARIARLHGARSTRLLLVDGMRWDVSRIVQEKLVAKLGTGASLTDELLLWSALPTTTMRQLETIARGVEALRSPSALEPECDAPRGRTTEYVRRMRVGPRELSKLDLVEARVQAARGNVLRELPEIAESAAEAIARHVDTLAPRTLLFIFGDHGFTLDKSGVARQGGASPEEVLVGAFSFLVGDVH